MLSKESLKDLLSQSDFTKLDKVLICLAVDLGNAKTVSEVKNMAVSSGLRQIKTWNVSDLLRRSKGRAVRTDSGWELTSQGLEHVSKLAGAFIGGHTQHVAGSLRAHLARITDSDTASFIEEAIQCFEHRMYRAAVVLSWIGGFSVLYHHVVKAHLAAFNQEAIRRNNKWKNARTPDDLARMKEKEFLDILESISLIGKSVKQELKNCLQLRNGCGHPNSLKISENRVSAHIEILVLNVFSRFNP